MKHILSFLFAASMLLLPLRVHSQQDSVAVADTMSDYVEFLVPSYEHLGKIISDPSSRFYYPTLLKRFEEADTTLTIEDIHCLYYGYVLQKDYDPYIHLDEEDQARDILNPERITIKEAQKALKLLDRAVKKAPMHLRLYMYRHYANAKVYGIDSKQAADDAFRYVALISAIAASGDGSDFATAFHVAIVSHSYNFMSYFGLKSTGQSLQYDEGQQFDVFSLEENEHGLENLYVNVTPCMNYLSKMFTMDEDDDALSEGAVDQFDISVGRKLTIKLDKKRKGEYKFRVVKYESCIDSIGLAGTDSLFVEDGEPNTIVFYCVKSSLASRPSVLLVMKSYCKKMLSYDTFIRLDGSPEFQSTSNSGLLPGVRGVEIWNDPVNSIRIAHIKPAK